MGGRKSPSSSKRKVYKPKGKKKGSPKTPGYRRKSLHSTPPPKRGSRTPKGKSPRSPRKMYIIKGSKGNKLNLHNNHSRSLMSKYRYNYNEDNELNNYMDTLSNKMKEKAIEYKEEAIRKILERCPIDSLKNVNCDNLDEEYKRLNDTCLSLPGVSELKTLISPYLTTGYKAAKEACEKSRQIRNVAENVMSQKAKVTRY